MSHNPVEKLVKMANQIGDYFVAQRAHDPVAGMVEHLMKFWDPSMRKRIIEHVGHGGEGLDPIALEAVKCLAEGGSAKS